MKIKLLNIIIIFVLILCGLYFFLSLIPFGSYNSDFANSVLAAQDVLNGNFMQKDWFLPGFFGSYQNILYNFTAFKLFGVSEYCASCMSWLNYIAILIASILLLNKEKRISLLNFLFFVTLAASSSFAVLWLNAHGGMWVLAIILIWLYDKIAQTNKKTYTIPFIIILIFSVTMDPIILQTVAIPILIISLIDLLLQKNKTQNKKNIFIILLSCIIAFPLAKLLFMLSGATNTGYAFGNLTFVGIDGIIRNIELYIYEVFYIFNAGFFGTSVVSLKTLGYFIRTIVIITGYYCCIKNIISVLSGKNTDIISSILSLGILISSIYICTTTFNIDLNCIRYINYYAIWFAIIILRYFNFFRDVQPNISKIIYLSIFLAFVLTLNPIAIKPTKNIYKYNEIIKFLDSKNLTYGRSDYWNASQFTVVTKSKIKIRAIIPNSDMPYNWLSKKSWYEEPDQFYLVENTKNMLPLKQLATLYKKRNIVQINNYYIFY